MPSSHLAAFIEEFVSVAEVEIDPGKVLAALCGLPDPRKRRGVRHRFPHCWSSWSVRYWPVRNRW